MTDEIEERCVACKTPLDDFCMQNQNKNYCVKCFLDDLSGESELDSDSNIMIWSPQMSENAMEDIRKSELGKAFEGL